MAQQNDTAALKAQEPSIEALKSKLELQKAELLQLQSKPASAQTPAYEPLNDRHFLLGFGLLGFSLVVMAMMAYLIRHGSDGKTVLRTFGTVLIVVAALFLIVVGYDEQQIAPIIGLLGTVAGYLLAQPDKKNKDHDGKQD